MSQHAHEKNLAMKQLNENMISHKSYNTILMEDLNKVKYQNGKDIRKFLYVITQAKNQTA